MYIFLVRELLSFLRLTEFASLVKGALNVLAEEDKAVLLSASLFVKTDKR